MNWVDGVILVLIALAAVHGWRTGAMRQVFALAGLLVGLAVGVELAPHVVGFAAPDMRGVAAVALIIAAAMVLAAVGEGVGARAGAVLRRIHLGALDGLLGTGIAVLSTLVVVWFFGTLAASGGVLWLNRGLRDSTMMQRIDGSMPSVPVALARIEGMLSSSGFPLVFADLPPQLLPPAAQPGDALTRRLAAAAGPSTVKVFGTACGEEVEGSGVVVAPGIVVTNAHVVAGDADPRVIDADGSHAATPIGFDPSLDVAVLAVPGLGDPALPLAVGTAARGTGSVALGYPGDGPLTAVPAAVDGEFPATGLDIYGTGVVTRAVYQLHAMIRPGNSGGPLVAEVGAPGERRPAVIGLVFARSTTDQEVGYALAIGPVATVARAAQARALAVGTGACIG